MVSKKKVTALVVALCFVMVGVIGGTIAYFTSEDEANNVFTLGNVKVSLDEAPVYREEAGTDANGDPVNDGKYVADDTVDRVKANTYEDIKPGEILPKDPTVHNIGSSDAYVRANITIPGGVQLFKNLFENAPASLDDTLEAQFLELIDELGEGWTLKSVEAVAGDVVVKLEYGLVATGADTTPMFENVIIPAYADNDAAGFEMNIVSEAIQTETFNNAEEAFAALDSQLAAQ